MKFITQLEDALYDYYNKRGKERVGTHVSDLLQCPRQAAFRRLDQLPVTDREIYYFMIGEAIHKGIQSILIQSNPERYAAEKEINFGGLIAHPDLYDCVEDTIIEIKSTRKKDIKEPYKHHIDQLKSYLALMDKEVGYIFYILYTAEDNMNIKEIDWKREFEVRITPEEKATKLEELKKDKLLFEKALETENPIFARHIKYNNTLNWLCRNCRYAPECYKMRESSIKELWASS